MWMCVEGTTQKETVSAIESNSIPNRDVMPSILAIFPSKTSNPCEAEMTSSGDQVLARDTLWW